MKFNDGGICQRQTDDRTVPRIVYFVVFGNYTFTFLHYVSVMAARRFIGPSALYVIGDVHPVGYWWQRIVSDCEGIRFVYRYPDLTVSGDPFCLQVSTCYCVTRSTLFTGIHMLLCQGSALFTGIHVLLCQRICFLKTGIQVILYQGICFVYRHPHHTVSGDPLCLHVSRSFCLKIRFYRYQDPTVSDDSLCLQVSRSYCVR